MNKGILILAFTFFISGLLLTTAFGLSLTNVEETILPTKEVKSSGNVEKTDIVAQSGSSRFKSGNLMDTTNNTNSSNQAPVASFYFTPNSGTVPVLNVLFNASNSYDPDGQVARYFWDLHGDGSYEFSTTNPIIQATFINPGTFVPQIIVSDNLGLNSTPVSAGTLTILANQTIPSNNTNFTYVSGCNTLSPVILNRVAELQANGHIIVKQELQNVPDQSFRDHFIIPGYLLKLSNFVNESEGFEGDQIGFTDVIIGEDYDGTISSEGHGTVIIGGNMYTFTYSGSQGSSQRYITMDFPQTTQGQIMTFNCNFLPFPYLNVSFTLPDNESLVGENMVFFASYPQQYAGFFNDGFTFEISNGSEVIHICDLFNNTCDFLTSSYYVNNGIINRVIIMNTTGFEIGRYLFLTRVFYQGSEVFVSNALTGRILPNNLVGDLNHDGYVNFLDLNILLYLYGQAHAGEADLNHDGVVDFLDLNMLLSNWTY